MAMTEAFWSFVIVSGSAFILGVLKMMYNSKCKEVSFCCLKVIRDVEVEAKEDAQEMSQGIKRQESKVEPT